MQWSLRLWLLSVSSLVLAFAPLAAAAQDEPAVDCANAMSTYEMNICADRDLETADGELNAVYKSALAAIPGMATDPPYDAKSWEAALRASQRAWLAFRDAECEGHVAMFWSGGTGATADIVGCKAEKTRERTKELKARYDNNR